ncbi:MAG: exosortase A system-associated hydrolase 1 [Candidatus Accumulibacter sp. BA-94]|uniref:hydrolase 1, exosortase A system-associated n=1 Tax=Accumulibacter sp. TaxID=2053492 RepID=UPI000451FC12|nr:hydrolase 1, exosortase A system-associated [Accumulibacter sp.]EXI84681.1 MAG: exosortase A system-associated hydrolase 1 [Candidatus Accumulibacter sp. BA-94]MBL8391464.1 hydrolase 1, exosortase A system-associated [Accumulibacter sp.]HRD87063.1 hydrolase 1, exosortase A system-associated [Accumulibacter sp.]
MSVLERAVLFPCEGEQLVGVVAAPGQALAAADRGSHCGSDRRDGVVAGGGPAATASAALPAPECGVLIIVGGPQYRVGSHRQFVLLSRRLAAEGYPSMRFDYRGMGDASGAMRSFEDVQADIGAAIDVFRRTVPSLRRIVLWGLCDAASAALLYADATPDPQVAGLVLVNPWVRSEASQARTQIKHYYGRRLLQREFWSKLTSGRMAVGASVRELLCAALRSRRRPAAARDPVRQSFQDGMAAGWRGFAGQVLLILSGDDYTAREFLEYTAADQAWEGLLEAAKVHRFDLGDADHTFSSGRLRSQVEDATLSWLAALEGARR